MSAPITETTDGVTLKKYREDKKYRLPSVVYEFKSNRVEPVTVELIESIPSELDHEHIGFHPDHGSGQWKARDETLHFEYELAPDSTYKTVLAVRPDAPCTVRELLQPPDELLIDRPPQPDVPATPAGSFTRSASSDSDKEPDRSSQPPSPRQINEDMNASISDIGSEDPPEGDETVVNGRGGSNDEDTNSDKDSMVERLVNAMEAGDLSEDDLQTLREEFQQTEGSMNARIEQLQSEFADLRAYIGALEEFLDEHGSGADIIDRLEQEADSHAAELASIEDRVDQQESRISSVQADVDDREEEIESLSSEIVSVKDELSELQSDVSSLDERIPEEDLEGRISDIEEELSDVSGFVSRLEEAFE